MFIAYTCIYIPLNQNIDVKLYISAKIEAVKHLLAIFLLTAEHRRRPIRLKRAMFTLTSLMSRGYVNFKTFKWFSIGLFSEYTENVNIYMQHRHCRIQRDTAAAEIR